jgi:hypothetical protein
MAAPHIDTFTKAAGIAARSLPNVRRLTLVQVPGVQGVQYDSGCVILDPRLLATCHPEDLAVAIVHAATGGLEAAA